MNLQKIFGEVEGDDAGAAAHAPEIKAQDIPSELVLVDNHGGERWGRVEKATVDNENPYFS